MLLTWNHPSSEDGDTEALLPWPACVLTERGAGRERTRAGCSWSGKLALGIKYGMWKGASWVGAQSTNAGWPVRSRSCLTPLGKPPWLPEVWSPLTNCKMLGDSSGSSSVLWMLFSALVALWMIRLLTLVQPVCGSSLAASQMLVILGGVPSGVQSPTLVPNQAWVGPISNAWSQGLCPLQILPLARFPHHWPWIPRAFDLVSFLQPGGILLTGFSI